jgi:hypothetical protein
MRGEIANMHSAVIVRECGRSSIPEAPIIEPTGRGVLDHPPPRVMTAISILICLGCLKRQSEMRSTVAGTLSTPS